MHDMLLQILPRDDQEAVRTRNKVRGYKHTLYTGASTNNQLAMATFHDCLVIFKENGNLFALLSCYYFFVMGAN